uniref:Uncharacterized protein n=1 Tax=Ceratitis capitata TaxID=7213 RepID=W8BX72_CERCA
MESKVIWIIAIFYTTLQHIVSSSSPLKRPRAGDPFDTFPKNFWQEFSSPFTDTPEDEESEITETTTHEPFPFFADPYTTVNVSTQLSSNVQLHCRVNDLNHNCLSNRAILENEIVDLDKINFQIQQLSPGDLMSFKPIDTANTITIGALLFSYAI